MNTNGKRLTVAIISALLATLSTGGCGYSGGKVSGGSTQTGNGNPQTGNQQAVNSFSPSGLPSNVHLLVLARRYHIKSVKAGGYSLFSSADGGRTWNRLRYPFPNHVLVFKNPQDGWGVSGQTVNIFSHYYPRHCGSLIRTTDGGRSWIRLPVPMCDPGATIMLNPLVGWLWGITNNPYGTGDPNILAKTTNGGITWTVINRQKIQEEYFISPKDGWARGSVHGISSTATPTYKNLYATTDGGMTWHLVSQLPHPFYGLFFLNRQDGWAFGGTHLKTLLHTTDGGQIWTVHVIKPGAAYANQGYRYYWKGMYFLNPSDGWLYGSLGGYYGVILHTTDGGRNWTVQIWNYSGQKNQVGKNKRFMAASTIRALSFINSRDGWAITGGQVLATTNGGRTWFPDLHSNPQLLQPLRKETIPAFVHYRDVIGRQWRFESLWVFAAPANVPSIPP